MLKFKVVTDHHTSTVEADYFNHDNHTVTFFKHATKPYGEAVAFFTNVISVTQDTKNG